MRSLLEEEEAKENDYWHWIMSGIGGGGGSGSNSQIHQFYNIDAQMYNCKSRQILFELLQ